MRKVIVSEFLTLDGVMQGPGDVNEDRSEGFEHGGWQLPYFDDAFGEFVMGGFATTGGMLLGRPTYDVFAAFWPNQPANDPVAPSMNDMQKYVASRTLEAPLAWQNSTLCAGRVAPRSSRQVALRFTRVAGRTSSAPPSGVCTAFGLPPLQSSRPPTLGRRTWPTTSSGARPSSRSSTAS
jgi:RibD domain-containing protein